MVVKCAGLHDKDAALAVLNAGTLQAGSIPEETEAMEIAAELLHEIDTRPPSGPLFSLSVGFLGS